MVDFSTYADLAERRRKARQEQSQAQAKFQENAGQQAAELRLSEPWQVWESHVRALLARDEAELERHMSRLKDADVSQEVLWLLRGRILVLNGRIEARKEDLALPEELERRGADAAKILEGGGKNT